ncbi:PfkB family carbohydrate kinase [Shewanella nanhaiensis]|uniref:Winged helix-turn-helix transcriptional regulator n=1 Tax=Shewanella nanhaiensis TaxID=2864872 RepID=A0ABS7E3U9_9GAMM|nr:PfkB family carbohydrate kinase [Shewanella nanhaiensis]MBW8184305.1 winged helix-turn-helix transcriptional regulator [Shewanella nanhaiensis]
MTEREHQILAILKQNPLIAQQDLADRLGISRSAVAGHIMNLTHKGIIRGKGYILAESRYAVVVGGANMDILGRPLDTLQVGDSNPGSVTCSPGGVGRNIAENLARLGSQTRLLSAVGKDTYGQAIIDQCQQAGIDMQACLQLKDASTSTYLSVLDGDSDMHVAINDMAILDRLSVELLKVQEEMLRRADLLILDANLSAPALEYLLSNFSDRPIFVDTVSCAKAKKIQPFLSAIHTLKPNLKEAEQLSGISIANYGELPKLGRWFHEQGVQRIFLSLGADGVFYSDGQTQALIPAVDVPMVNANGAGDAFLAGLAHGWLQDWDIEQSTKFAMAAAVVALSHLATINPNMSEMSVNRVIKESIC